MGCFVTLQSTRSCALDPSCDVHMKWYNWHTCSTSICPFVACSSLLRGYTIIHKYPLASNGIWRLFPWQVYRCIPCWVEGPSLHTGPSLWILPVQPCLPCRPFAWLLAIQLHLGTLGHDHLVTGNASGTEVACIDPLLHCLYITFTGKEKMPLLCIAVFRILVNCEPLSHFFRVQSISSRAVWGHPACFKSLLYLQYGQYPPVTHDLGQGGPLTLRWVVPSALGWVASFHSCSHSQRALCVHSAV